MEGKESHKATQFLRRALQLAWKGHGFVSPNPLVGAVLVKDGNIIGEGFHRKYGEKHAEAWAFEDAKKKGYSVEGADLYCTLEPCCFTGPEKHQPPCTDLILRNRIARVFVCTLDPNPQVRGKGIQILRDAGVEVNVGILSSEALRLNEGFFTYQIMNRPFVHLKIAQSIDGRIAALEGDSRWITDERARRRVHILRSTYDAVLVGKNTVQVDDPELTVRLVPGRNPYRVVLDTHLKLPLSSRIFHTKDPDRTIVIAATPSVSPKQTSIEKGPIEEKRKALEELGVRVILVPATSHRPSLSVVLSRLGDLGIRSILVEGGASVFTSFLQETLFDRISFFLAPMVIGKGIEGIGDLGIRRISDHLRLDRIRFRRIGNQIMIEGYRPGFYEKLFQVAVPSSLSTIKQNGAPIFLASSGRTIRLPEMDQVISIPLGSRR
ncbi:MAG: bifunctional diaminohydroxyphosphoribosylaminopyrimidine deaminase/5-amino-6-(5-phosphoribosylamino)uracil reductase RibD [Spirochaetes bacterium]|nr:bifunctional diaminohydroxyphosphoribosylaminopyrimidine deaminase/5-amino-6-(5-phosphoribosylamino)uracil reductase RibD [Spirochaetota bacterium]